MMYRSVAFTCMLYCCIRTHIVDSCSVHIIIIIDARKKHENIFIYDLATFVRHYPSDLGCLLLVDFSTQQNKKRNDFDFMMSFA